MQKLLLLLAVLLVSAARASEPIVAPEFDPPFFPEGKPLDGLIITLDPGHGGSAHQGGYAGSARGIESRVVEGDLNFLVTAILRWHLIEAGAQVHMTRWDDRKVTLDKDGEPSGRAEELGARTAVADRTASHLFLALHHNSTTRETANGVVILIDAKDSEGREQPLERQFADILREEVQKAVHSAEEFPHYEIEHPLVSGSDIPSAVVEFGFLSNRSFDEWVARRGSHRIEARAVYNAIVRMWTENREALEKKRAELFPNAPPPKKTSGTPETAKSPLSGVAAQLWPLDRAPQTAREVENIIDLYRRTTLNDRTVLHLDATVTRAEEGWVLDGSVNHPMVKEAVAQLLDVVGVKPLQNNMRVLPDREKLGDRIYGETQIPMALTWGKPVEGESVQTQLLLGDRLFILDESDDRNFYLVHAADGYLGWVRREAVRRMNAEEFRTRGESPRIRISQDYMADDFRLPAGASLPLVAETAETEGAVTVGIPAAVRGTGHKEWAEVPADHVTKINNGDYGRRAAEAALEYITTPYVFGGRSRLGIDCSGLMSASYATTGLTLPRDAWQQADSGQLVATPWYRDGLQPGDLLFFLDETGRVYHVGMSIGGSRFVHASPPEVHISSLDPADELYAEEWSRAFAFARRPME